VQLDDLEPVVEILPEGAARDTLGEVPVGRRQDAHVDPSVLGLADPADLPLLEGAQQLHLHARRDLPDLVEKKGPHVGRLEQARPVMGRAGERAPGVSEEFALEERLRDGAAVDRDEGPRDARGFLVDEPRDPFLARSALAGDEDGGIDLGQAARQVHELSHGGALGDDPQRLLDVGGHPDDGTAVFAELSLGCLQRLRDPVERDIQAIREALRLVESQLLGALVAPLVARSAEEVARSVALAEAAVLEGVDLLAGAPAEVATGEATDGPAYGHVGATEVQEMLLGLVGGADHHALPGGQRGATPPRCPT
jgi:hypothetical protein